MLKNGEKKIIRFRECQRPPKTHNGTQTDDCIKQTNGCQTENGLSMSCNIIKGFGENKGTQTYDVYSVDMYPRSTQTDLDLLTTDHNRIIISNDFDCQTDEIKSIDSFTQTDFLIPRAQNVHTPQSQFLLPKLISGTLLAALAGMQI